jgi:uncharacterized protein (DUF2062 family)
MEVVWTPVSVTCWFFTALFLAIGFVNIARLVWGEISDERKRRRDERLAEDQKVSERDPLNEGVQRGQD